MSREPDLEVVGAAASLGEAPACLAGAGADVVLLDLRFPDGSGVDLLLEANGLAKPPGFIIVSSFETPQHIDAAVRHGASGFVPKTAPSEEIVRTIRRVAAGQTAFTAAQLGVVRLDGWAPLGKRDRQTAELVLQGRSNDEIAQALGVGRRAVELRLARLFKRFEVTTRTELALLAEREQWLADAANSGRPWRRRDLRDRAPRLGRDIGRAAPRPPPSHRRDGGRTGLFVPRPGTRRPIGRPASEAPWSATGRGPSGS